MDFKNYLDLAENDWDFMGKLMHQSIAGLKELKHEYQEAVATQNPGQLRDAIHKIKPTLMILEATTLLDYLGASKNIMEEIDFPVGKALNQAALVNQTIEEMIEIIENYRKNSLPV